MDPKDKNCRPAYAQQLSAMLMAMMVATMSMAQPTGLPTRGKRFWTGYMQNGFGAQGLKVHILSTVPTTGTVSIPGNGWSTSFSVGANVVSVLDIPVAAEHFGSGIVEQKGVLITSQDSIDVHVGSFQNWTQDLTQVLPETSLGTVYRVDAYSGVPNFNNLQHSEFLIVATEDGTQVRITPSVATGDGRPANVPYTVDLDQGESYQVQALSDAADLTGTLIEATEASGSCRPFAVLGGSTCASVPAGCSACDAIFDQMLPISAWGERYYTVPINGVNTATFRVLAHTNNTSVTIGSAPAVVLQAGQTHEVNGSNAAVCINASQPVSVVQLMEGYACAAVGDPSMLVLSPADRISYQASFHSVNSPQVNQHSVSLVVPTAAIGQLTLDGLPVNNALFQPYPACPERSFARVPVGSGVHRLASPAGFQAYMFGIGWGESYASSVNGIGQVQVQEDSLVCGGGTITLQAPFPLNNAEWTTATDPDNPFASGPAITITPNGSESYTVTGTLAVSGCPRSFTFHVGVPLTIPTLLTANGQPAINVCQYEPLQLALVPPPDTAWFDIDWSPSNLLNHPNIAEPLASPQADTWFKVSVSSPSGCGDMVDSILVNVTPAQILDMSVFSEPTTVCAGATVQLASSALRVVAMDNFDGNASTMWTAIQGGSPSNACGALSGMALRFGGNGTRSAQTIGLNTTNGGEIRFRLKIAQGLAPCEAADSGEDVVLEYSMNNGLNWNNLHTYGAFDHSELAAIEQVIPAPAQGPNTMFRIRQLANSGTEQDIWLIDEFFIGRYDDSWLDYTWSGSNVSTPDAPQSSATPTTSGWYVLNGVDPTAGCTYTDSVQVTVEPVFTIALGNDTTLCDPGDLVLTSTPSYQGAISYVWTPDDGTLSATNTPSPLATPTATTTYTVHATTASGCTDSADITITMGTLEGLTIQSSSTSICQGQSVELNAMPVGGSGLSYAWTGAGLNNTTTAGPIATPTVTTTYTCTVSEAASGCTRSASITIQVTTGYTVSVGPDLDLCTVLGEELFATHNIPNPTYTWVPAANLNAANIQGPEILIDASATFVVTVSDANGCSATDTVVVARALEGVPSEVTVMSCADSAPVLAAPLTDVAYEWSTGANTATITVQASGSYTVTMTDVDGCEAHTTFQVALDPLPIVDLGPDLSLCGVTSHPLSTGNPEATTTWSHGPTSADITITASGTYAVTVTDANGCTASDSISIALHAGPIDVLQDVTACSTTSVSLDAGNPGASFLWNTGSTEQVLDPNTSGTYSVTITTPEQCSATFDAEVLLTEPPIVDLGPDTSICEGEQITLTVGAQAGNIAWSNGSTLPAIEVDQSGTFTVTITNGTCIASDAIQVSLLDLPADLLQDITQCIDQPTILNAGGPEATYLWNTGATTPGITATNSGNYSVQVIGENGCPATFNANVQLIQPPTVDLGADTVLCEGQLLRLDAGNPGASFLWNNGATTRRMTVSGTGTYSVTVNNGCVRSDDLSVRFDPSPASMAVKEFHTCLDDEPKYVVLDAGNSGASFDWSTGESSQVIMAGAYGIYYVQITNQFNCSVRDSAQVFEFCPATIFVPNTFTPNGDGLNDVFIPVGKNIAELQLRVFDRWGGLLFETTDLTMGWDGTYAGELVKNDMYVWRMTYKFFTDEVGSVGFEQHQMGAIQVLY